MCEVCAHFGAGEHWSDHGRPRDIMQPFPDIRHYRRERARRIAFINALVEGAGCTCSDWDGDAFEVTDALGRSVIAPSLNDLWPAIEKLSGKRIDPLSPAFIGAYAR